MVYSWCFNSLPRTIVTMDVQDKTNGVIHFEYLPSFVYTDKIDNYGIVEKILTIVLIVVY